MNDFFMDPWTQIGLGILSANRPGVSAGQAIGQGGLLGINNLAELKSREEQAKFRQLQAEGLKEEMARAKAAAAEQAKFMSDLEQTDPARAAAYREMSIMGTEPYKTLNPTPSKPPTGMRLGPNGEWVVDPAWMQMQRELKALGATRINNAPNFTFNPLEKSVTAGLQNKSIAGQTVLPAIDRLISDVEALPEGVGWIGETREDIGGVLGQIGALGVPLAQEVSEFVRPETMVDDPNEPGGQRVVSPQTISSASEALSISLKPLIADSGPLSNQDRLRLDRAVGALRSGDAKSRKQALQTVKSIITTNVDKINNFLGISGSTIPGQRPAPEIGSVDNGYEYIGGDPSLPGSWRQVK